MFSFISEFLSEGSVGTTFTELRDDSSTPVELRDPFTRRLDSLSSSDQRHSRDLGSLTNKLRTVDAKVEAMGAISVRQKDQEIEELRRELEVYKGLLADLTDKQGKFEEALQLLRERASEVSKTSKTSDQFVSPEKLEAVTQELQDRVGTFIKTVNANLRLNDSDGASNFPAELDGLQGRLAGLEEDVRNVRRGREFTEERLGKVEGVCLNVLSNVFGESKADAMRYFRATSGFPGKVDPGAPRTISTGVGTGPGVNKSDLLTMAHPTAPGTSEASEVVVSENEQQIGEAKGDSEVDQEGKEHGDTVSTEEYEERGDSEGLHDGEMPHTPDFVPSINDGAYTFSNIDGSPVERAIQPKP